MKYTIPPATAWAFEKYVHEILVFVETDREAKLERAYELQTQLQEYWHECDHEIMTDEEAKEYSLKRLGSVKSVARSLQDNTIQTHLLGNDFRLGRILAVFLYWWLVSLCAKSGNRMQDIFKLPDGSLLTALLSLYLAAQVPRGMAHFAAQIGVRVHQVLGQVLNLLKWFGVAACFYTFRDSWGIFIAPFVQVKLMLANAGEPWISYVVWLCSYSLLCCLSATAVLSGLAEIFDWPGKKRERNEFIMTLFYNPRALPNLLRRRFSFLRV